MTVMVPVMVPDMSRGGGGAATVVPIIAETPKSASERLAELKKLMDDGLITEEEYAGSKAKVLIQCEEGWLRFCTHVESFVGRRKNFQPVYRPTL